MAAEVSNGVIRIATTLTGRVRILYRDAVGEVQETTIVTQSGRLVDKKIEGAKEILGVFAA